MSVPSITLADIKIIKKEIAEDRKAGRHQQADYFEYWMRDDLLTYISEHSTDPEARALAKEVLS